MGAQKQLGDVDAILIPGGFGERGVDGKVGAIQYARENKIPLLGICLGLQCIVIEAARNLAEIPDANSTEFDATTAHPVISTMEEQLAYVEGAGDLGGTMRLGLYPAKLADGSIVREVYANEPYVDERHRHRYEVNNAYRAELEKKAGLVFSGTSRTTSSSSTSSTRVRCTPTWSPPRPTRSSGPARPARTRSSRAW